MAAAAGDALAAGHGQLAAARVHDDRLLLRRGADVEVDVVVAEAGVAVNLDGVLRELRVDARAGDGHC